MKHLKRLGVNLLFVLLLCNISNSSFAKESTDHGKAPLKEMTLHVIPQSHIDLAWWWRYDPETIHVIVKHTLEIAFDNMEKYPDYTFTFLQVPAIEPLENLYPELYYKFRYYAHNSRALGGSIRNPGAHGAGGRLAIGSGLWCEVDGCLPCGESLVRQVLFGKRFFMREFGIDVKTAWFQDAWTHPWTWPQILKKSGIDSYMFTRPRGKGEQIFWWQSPDGSRIFAYKPFKAYGESLPAGAEIDERLLMMNQRYGVRDDITLVGVGNHGGGALKADVERMRKTIAARQEQHAPDDTQAKIIFSTPDRFVNAVMREKHNLPVVNNELTATIRGAYTTVGEIKKGNRYAENLLLTLEKFSAIAAALGEREYPRAAIFSAWKKVMINQFHDTISGTDIPPAIDDALRRYANIMAVGRRELDKSLQAISSRINTTGKGVPIIVFNPLSWKRSDVVETSIEFPQPVQTIRIQDNEGNDIPSQIISKK
ncbi:MAG: hypothetical protein GXO76_01990, partial [Calditrichaeota bacterium]|nr:hypothetical protein [Calditrichota bacterium]